jgi:hypothetical protein
LRAVSDNAAAHSDTLFSLPGIYSFNLWTNRPTPTQSNVTAWFLLLSPIQQEEIISRLRADPRAGLLVERTMLNMAEASARTPPGPLQEYLNTHFTPALKIGTHEFWTKRGRTIAPLSTAQLYQRTPGSTGAEWRLELCVATTAGTRIASAEWVGYSGSGPGQTRVTLNATNCEAEVTPIFSNSMSAGPLVTGRLPMSVPILARIAFATNEPLGALSRHAVVVLRDPDGKIVAEAVFPR